MHGLISRISCRPGPREAGIAILLEGVSGMPGFLGYVVAEGAADADFIVIPTVPRDGHGLPR